MSIRPSVHLLVAAALAAPTFVLGPLIHSRGALEDLQPAASAPTDGARGSVSAVAHRSGTLVVLRLRGLDRAAAGQTYGAHVHVGPCVAGDGAAAGPHYNHDVATGRAPVEVSPRTEVWLDFTVTPGGTAHAIAHVPFTIEPGDAGSVVVHALPTDPTGAAGARLACLPVGF